MLKNLIAILLVTLVAIQPLGAIAEAHPVHQSGAQHSPLDLLHTGSNLSLLDHQHEGHTQVYAPLKALDQAFALDTGETPDCDHCSHTHATYSAFVASASLLTTLASTPQGSHFYRLLQPIAHSASPYRPPRS